MKNFAVFVVSLLMLPNLAGAHDFCGLTVANIRTWDGSIDPNFLYRSDLATETLRVRNFLWVERLENAQYSLAVSVASSSRSPEPSDQAHLADEEYCHLSEEGPPMNKVWLTLIDAMTQRVIWRACKNVPASAFAPKRAIRQGIIEALEKLPYTACSSK